MVANATAIDKDHPIKSATYNKAKKIQKQRSSGSLVVGFQKGVKNEKLIWSDINWEKYNFQSRGNILIARGTV